MNHYNHKRKKQKKITKRIKRKISNYFEDDEELLVRRKFQRRAKERNYRIASLFGDSQISNGGEMTNDVIKALKKHGLPKKDEDTPDPSIIKYRCRYVSHTCTHIQISKYQKTYNTR